MLLYTKQDLTNIVITAYLQETDEIKQAIRDNVFEMYAEANGFDMHLTFADIKDDLQWLETIEQYEGCAMLQDILTEFG